MAARHLTMFVSDIGTGCKLMSTQCSATIKFRCGSAMWYCNSDLKCQLGFIFVMKTDICLLLSRLF